jgi:exonuclease SbcD
VVELVQRQMSQLVRAAEGRLLALRVVISGATPAHAELERRSELLQNQLRAAAHELGEGEVWIEKVVTSTRPDLDLAALRERSDALGELASAFRRVAADPAALAEHAAELGELRDKLPQELLEDPESALGRDPGSLARLFDEAERLLLARLLAPHEPARNS